MSDYTSSLKSFAIFWAPLLPAAIISSAGLFYTGLAFGVTWTIIFVGHRQFWLPEKLGRLFDTIHYTSQIFKATKSDCTRVAMMALAAPEQRFLKARRSASEIKELMLTMNEKETWMEWFRASREMGRRIDQCVDDVRGIRTEILVIAEKDHQRKISEEIKESQEVLPTIDPSSVPRTNRRRFGLQAIPEVLQELV
ncbi:hypothetical protein FB45DRAFT_871547 [Roridomyces roridus]|uniref:Uncharacterized protein n=1 Tax=Roridomyces roridus TaxID=1738132 RepID=A0AAD7FGM3_9AGAR|nr:hypothetical protein FB45DRAFT_871547 [Roridomyces roridus]